ncbi:MAG: EboA domain-containing protein [Planctomycetota bacterium]
MCSSSIQTLLSDVISDQLPPAAAEWFATKRAAVAADSGNRALFLAISLVTRKLGKADLIVTDAIRARASEARRDWCLDDWSIDQAARVLLLLEAPGDAPTLAARLEELCVTADMGELVAFYRGLPLYPQPEQYVARAGEGLRTNIKAVFNAIAHNNPYPREQFDELAWNQMVLKALFIDTPLHPMQGLDDRSSPALAKMLCDYAHERWAAGREFSPELWRCVGRHADAAALDDLGRSLTQDRPEQARAAALALTECSLPAAAPILDEAPQLAAAARAGEIRWESILDP